MVWIVSAAGQIEGGVSFGPYQGWATRALDVASDNRATLLWGETTGWTSLWLLSPAGEFETAFSLPPHPD